MAETILERNNVTVSGEGNQALVFAHGFGCDQHMWRFVTPAFEEDYKIILFDYVGSGNSDVTAYQSERYSSLDGYARDVLDIIRAMDLNDLVFVGHSVSSIIGALASIRAPERFKSLVMIGPSPRYLDDPPDYHGGFDRDTIEELLALMDKNYIGWANFFAPEVMKNKDQPELTRELEESFCSTDPVIAHEFAQATFLADNREDLPKIEVPVLVVQSGDDSIAPEEVGHYVHSSIPESTLEILPTTGHCPHLSHPELTAKTLQNYLQHIL